MRLDPTPTTLIPSHIFGVYNPDFRDSHSSGSCSSRYIDCKKHIPAKQMKTPSRSDWPFITEFGYRKEHFRRWALASVFTAAVLAASSLYLSAIAIIILMPLQAALIHLRCPSCNLVTTLTGVTVGRNCRSCGQRLLY